MLRKQIPMLDQNESASASSYRRARPLNASTVPTKGMFRYLLNLKEVGTAATAWAPFDQTVEVSPSARIADGSITERKSVALPISDPASD